MYQRPVMKRVYYSWFIPVNGYDKRLPVIIPIPGQLEHRLYQSDWLLRFYYFRVDEIMNTKFPHLDLEVDPKLARVLCNPNTFRSM